jgi:hypothetical protein
VKLSDLHQPDPYRALSSIDFSKYIHAMLLKDGTVVLAPNVTKHRQLALLMNLQPEQVKATGYVDRRGDKYLFIGDDLAMAQAFPDYNLPRPATRGWRPTSQPTAPQTHKIELQPGKFTIINDRYRPRRGKLMESKK